MKSIKLLSFLLFIHLALMAISFGQNNEQIAELYDQIKNVSLDEEKVAEVEGIVLIRDAATFCLNQGKICLLKSIQGKVTGAVFVGEGVFEFSPPTEIERYQLKKFTKQETLREEFKELYLTFSDTTGIELESKLNFSRGEVPGKFKSIKNNCPKRLLEKTDRNLWYRILTDIVADSMFRVSHPDRSDGFFYADVETKNLGRLFFTFDPKEVEEVTLEKSIGRFFGGGYDLVCSFHRKDDYMRNANLENTPIPHENKDQIKVTHYKMEVEIDEKEWLSAVVEMDYESLVGGIRLINFALLDSLAHNMYEIIDEEGKTIAFRWEEKQLIRAIILPEPTKAGKKGKLIFKYSGKAIEQNWYGDFFIRTNVYWYPRFSYMQRSTYDLTFKCPKRCKFVSIGEKVDEWIEGNYLCTRWVEDFPVDVASFNYGDFDIYELKLEGIPPVSVYYLEDSHRKYTADYDTLAGKYARADILLLGSKTKENIGADIANSLNLFQKIYGKYPFSKLAATEIPAFYGQGLPTLLYLSWRTYQTDKEFVPESFRAHEVSHQWWGHIVGWETYHDQWLSEGFAEYSGAWYAQLSLKNNKRFFKEIEGWQKDILGKGYADSKGAEAGPLWLGYRLSSSKSSDYATLVYEKGAYVLHMLRNMMMNYNTKSDDRFIGMMRDFVRTYYGKEASTEDFKQIVEKHIGQDMEWFFDQWVYGVEIPTYNFSYAIEKTPEGKYVVTCDIEQENVSKNFKMQVPVLLDFGHDQYAILRIWIDKPRGKYQLPKAPLKPKKVILNPYHAVLCEVKNK